MTVTAFDWRLGVELLPSISLEDLNAQAALQTRVDRKYVVDPDVWTEVLAQLAADLVVLEIEGRRASAYRSTYYDTPELDSYLAAARRRARRFKVRRRDYLDSGEAMVEVKVRSARGDTVKHRAPLAPCSEVARMVAIEDFAATFEQVGDAASDLQPVLVTEYLRTTLLHPQGRVTVDSEVTATDTAGRRVDYGNALIVETKSAGGAGAVDRALWARGVRPARLSKYATSLAALRPELPSNRWHRTLQRTLAA